MHDFWKFVGENTICTSNSEGGELNKFCSDVIYLYIFVLSCYSNDVYTLRQCHCD